MPDLVVYVDGGARGNPGPAAIGVVITDGEDRVVREHRECFGVGTNNEAEYHALIKGLEMAAEGPRGTVACVMDSELVVRQMAGTYRVKNERIAALYARARELASSFERVTFEHRPRLSGRLERADELVNRALDEAAEDYRTSGMGWPHVERKR